MKHLFSEKKLVFWNLFLLTIQSNFDIFHFFTRFMISELATGVSQQSTPCSWVRFLGTTTGRAKSYHPSWITSGVLNFELFHIFTFSDIVGICYEDWRKENHHLKAVLSSFQIVVLLFSYRAYSAHKCNAKFHIQMSEITKTGGETTHDASWYSKTRIRRGLS